MNWRPFDIESFLKASRHWKEDKEKLKKELNDLSYLPSINNESGIRSSNTSDLTAQTAIRRLKIQAEIEEIQLCEEMLAFALKNLSEDELRLIKGFYYPKKQIGVFVQEYGMEHGLCKNLVYAKRKNVLDKLRDVIEEKY